MKQKAPYIIIERFVVGQMATNCYLLTNPKTKDALIIDPGDDAQYIIEKIVSLEVKPRAIVATHGHFDHIMAGFELEHTYDIPFIIHAEDVFLVKRMKESAQYFLGMTRSDPEPVVTHTCKDGQTLSYGGIELTVMQTAGHTPGSVCLKLSDQAVLFVGDSVFADGGVGRTDFQYSSRDALQTSLRKIFAFSADTVLYPGHGESTTAGKEKAYYAVQ